MAGASLIALLWNSIPDYVKVLVVALTGMALTGTGAWTARRPRSNRVAAATVMGTGGGLVYVAIIGSVLLGEVDADIAFFLLTAWSLLLVILAVRTRILFTMLIVGAGGAVTVVLAGTYAGDHPDQALAAIWAICLHSICLGAVCAIVARASAPAKLRAAYAGPSFVVTVVAGAVAPLDAASRISFASAASALALTLLLSFLQYGLLAHWEAERAPENAHFIGGGWFAVDLAAMFVLLRLYTAPEGTWDPMWKFALIAAVMTGTALLAAATPMEWHVAVYAGISSSVATTLFAMACRSEWSDRPEMLVVVIAAVGLSAAPSIRHRDGTPTLIVPCALIVMGARSHSDADKAVLALSGVVVAAAVMAPMEYASSPGSPSDSPSALPAGPGAEKTGKSGDSGAFENSETVRAPRESAESTTPRTHAPRASYGWPTGSPASVVRGFDPPTVTWGSGHRGVDLSLQAGSPVLAAGDGTVVFAGAVAGRPVVSIDHADGVRTTYEPVEASVAAGDVVTRGQTIGTLLAGHRSDGVDALHWGARTGPKSYINPLRLLHPAVIRLKPLRSERSEQNQPG